MVVEHQEIYALLLGLRRNPETGRYPERAPRDAWAIPIAEYMRKVIISVADDRDIDVITTNSDGDKGRRQLLLGFLGHGATELVIDPGIAVVTERLSVNGVLSNQCGMAISRWYSRK